MAITQTSIQNKDNLPVSLYELRNNTGTTIKITNIGATITSILTPDRNGIIEEVTLGFNNPLDYISEKYKSNCPYLGTTAGRFANRIDHGRFSLNEKCYQLACNNGDHHLHGGPEGFHFKLWHGELVNSNGKDSLVLRLNSPHMEEGYPGNLEVKLTFTLTDHHELIMEYYAETDQATPVNLTNHAYFNLSGKKETILDHEAMIIADFYTPKVNSIPTGEIAPVEDTPFDFRTFHKIGDRFAQLEEDAYDHNFVLNLEEGILSPAAIVFENNSGRLLEVFTTMPGIQFYSGYYLDGSHARGDRKFDKFEGFCLETQYFPDSPNKPDFPTCIATPERPFQHTTVYKFGVDN
jgi:aldose 1-epimerase